MGKVGRRPPRGNIVLLKTMIENEMNTAQTEPESIPGSGNRNSNEAGLWCFSLGSVSKPHVRHVRLVLLILTGTCSCLKLSFSCLTFPAYYKTFKNAFSAT